MKNYGVWTNAQKVLQSKRDSEAKMQTTGKTDKLPIVQAEIKDVGVVWLLIVIKWCDFYFSGNKRTKMPRRLLTNARKF